MDNSNRETVSAIAGDRREVLADLPRESKEQQMTEIEKKLPQRVKLVLAKMNDGQRLCKSFRNKESGDTEINFTFEPSGKRCGPKTAQAAIETGLLKPLGDGLFEPEFSQSWEAP